MNPPNIPTLLEEDLTEEIVYVEEKQDGRKRSIFTMLQAKKLNSFWRVRIATFLWGLSVTYYFTQDFGLTSQMFLVQVIGNTFLMKALIK